MAKVGVYQVIIDRKENIILTGADIVTNNANLIVESEENINNFIFRSIKNQHSIFNLDLYEQMRE